MNLLIIKTKEETVRKNKGSLLAAVCGEWVLNVNRAKTVDYILAVVEGHIEDVFVAEKWTSGADARRYKFYGKEAPEEIRKLFKAKTLPEKFTRPGLANPTIYATGDDFGISEGKETKSSGSAQTCEPSYKIKATVSSINFSEKSFKIKGCDGYFSEDENKGKWNRLKNNFGIKAFEADKDVLKYDDKNKDDLWDVLSNAFDSRRCYMFDVIIGDDDSLLVKSISQIDA